MNTIPQRQEIEKIVKDYQLEEVFPSNYHAQLQLVTYQKGQAICHQGEELNALSYVLKGKLKIVRRLFNGKEYILETPMQPTIIGDIELMTRRGAVSSVIALEEVQVVQLPLYNKDQLLKDPLFLFKIGQNLAESLYRQNISASTNISYSVKERLATHILTVQEDGHFQLNLPILADTFGTSYRHLMRVIKQLLDQNIISKPSFKHYQIENRSALEQLVIEGN
ncbi:cyclic nucleotide-binding domain-containing protein [Streptococcus loxodontisalivarius]|uniref:CRP-like cAMP-binding protein n=1 Tax=Streptococcus loxodontisalivarius TaxID=1349415 RepID=A0ABS2PR28_9STRE|nr:cyclic nucleotide-binding domain-containing protein [Streptococcus loxodontisalivarius]MBM7642496.1 CRP-like cAMP-binding protein [Streptococcus loxodontisalivarius]